MTDVCLCEYTSHGHCGVLVDGEVDNDATPRAARAHRGLARRGRRRRRRAERHDGRPGRARSAPRSTTPARDDADPRLLGEVRVGVLRPVPRGRRLGARVRRPPRLPDGSRRTCARRCASASSTSTEGADALMVKPALPYLDVIRAARERVRPAARRVQRVGRVRDGEGRRAARAGSTSAQAALESLTAIKRAGADLDRHVLDEGPRRSGSDARARELCRRALELIPGGVNSPVRAMRAVGLDEPFFVARGEGAYLEDVDGSRYLDWVHVVGAADLRPRRPRDGRGGARGGAARHELRRADRARGRARRGDRRRGAVGREGAPRLVRAPRRR